MVPKIAAYFFTKDEEMMKYDKKSFPAKFWAYLISYVYPKSTVKVQMFFKNMYHWNNLMPDDIFAF